MTTTVRGLVAAIEREVRDTELQPARARLLINQLPSLMASCNAEIREADVQYAAVLLRFLDSDEAANRATIRAECSPEYRRKREARDTLKLVTELLSVMKHTLRSFTEEIRLGGRT